MKMKPIVICQLVFLLFGGVCRTEKSTTGYLMFECVLDSYIESFRMKLGNEISVIDTKGWTDSTSIVSIKTLDSGRLTTGHYWYSEYKSIKIYYSQSKFENDDLQHFMEKESLFPSKLKWELVQIDRLEDQQNIVPPEQFDEVQIIYNYYKKCIVESDMMGYKRFKEKIESKCGLCKPERI